MKTSCIFLIEPCVIALLFVLMGCGSDKSEIFSRQVDCDLARAASTGDIAGMDAAIAAGADVNAVGKAGYTPLFLTYREYRNKEGFEYLLEKDADPNQTANSGEAIMNMVAHNMDDSEWLRMALEHGGDPNLPWKLAPHGRATGSTPLWDAIALQCVTNLELLLEHGADLDVADDRFGDTPLLFAVKAKEPIMAKWLLEHGADWTIENSDGVDVADIVVVQTYDATFFPEKAAAHEWILDFLEEKGVDLVATEQRSREHYGPNYRPLENLPEEDEKPNP